MNWRPWRRAAKPGKPAADSRPLGAQDLPGEVFAKEVRYLNDRRKAADSGHEPVPKDAPPASDNDLVGLALSGGGIRSATFNLGLLQSLESHGAFRQVDYLSTVSGGGFLGASLSTLMSQQARRGEDDRRGKFPFPHSDQKSEAPEVTYLRNNSNYLAPNGLLDYLRMLGVLVRGILLNFVVLVPFLLVASMVVILLYGSRLTERFKEDGDRQRLDTLLGRTWSGIDDINGIGTVTSLFDDLERQALFASHRGMTPTGLLYSLQGMMSARPETPLIRGSGDDPRAFAFVDGATRQQIVARLEDSGALMNVDALEELDAIEFAVRRAGGEESLAAGPPNLEFLGPEDQAAETGRPTLYRKLRDMGLLASGPGSPSPGESSSAADETDLATDSPTVAQSLSPGAFLQILTEASLAKKTGQKAGFRQSQFGLVWIQGTEYAESANLRKILKELYLRGAYDPRWLRANVPRDYDRPLAYWEFVELAGVRDALDRLRKAEARVRGAVEAAKKAPAGPAEETLVWPDQRALLALMLCKSEFLACFGSGGFSEAQERVVLRELNKTGELADAELIAAARTLSFPRSTEPGTPSWELSAESGNLEATLQDLSEKGRQAEAGLTRAARTLYYEGSIKTEWFDDSIGRSALWQSSAAPELLRDLREQESIDRLLERIPLLSPPQQATDVPAGSTGDSPAPTTLPALEARWLTEDQHFPRVYANDESPDHRFDPSKLRLPWTVALGSVGLVWIALFPFLLWARRLGEHLWSRPKWSRRGLSCLLALTGLPILLLLVLSLLALGPIPATALLGMLVAAVVLARRLGRLRGALWSRGLYERSFSALLALIGVAAFVELQPYLIYHYQGLNLDASWSVALGTASLLVSVAAGPAMAFFKRAGRLLVLLLVGLLGPVLPLMIYVNIVISTLYSDLLWKAPYTLDPLLVVLFFASLALVFHLINLPLDINSTSLHSFYRDGLSRAYLIGHGTDGEMRPEDDLSLRDICLEGTGAPYHLINVALNLQGSSDPTVRRRRSDFFTFSRDYVGGQRTGYCPTRDMERVFPRLHLSSAVAVSAAAAAPNMGTFTFGPLVVLMALLNIRLGFWLPNPSRVNRWTRPDVSRLRRFGRWIGFRVIALAGSFRARPGAYSLLKEMLSLMHDRSRFVNLSDGGHIENTGAYELLRRRCRFVIIGDGEADPQMSLGALATLMRYARIDLGIEIEIHLDDLRPGADGQSRQHCAIGVIHYPEAGGRPSESGLLLYVKASLTGDEDQVVAEYRERSESFPHESTADQSFSEGQFEAYRDLGFHIGEGLFGQSEFLGDFEAFSLWFQKLRITLSPGLASHLVFSEISKELTEIDERLRETGVEPYFYEIYPDLRPESDEPAATSISGDAFRDVFNLVGRQLRLMQTLFVTLELGQKGNLSHPANRGWMNLFHRWAQAPTFKRVYLRAIGTYSGPFQQFCESGLGLDLQLSWLGVEGREPLQGWPEPASGKQDEPREIGRLVARVEGCREELHIGSASLSSGRVAVTMRKGYGGAGMTAKAELALERWATDNKVRITFERPLASPPEAGEVPPADLGREDGQAEN